MLILSIISTIQAQNYVQNGDFAQIITDSTYDLPVPNNWTLTGKAKTTDGSWIFNMDTTWLPSGASGAVKFTGASSEPCAERKAGFII
jgi:hypothetical protein